MSELSKRELRERSAQLRALLCEWDPIGVINEPDVLRDEYDHLVGPLLTLLVSNANEEEIARYLRKEIDEHFGLVHADHNFIEVAKRVSRWFDEQWRSIGEPVTIFVALLERGLMSGVLFKPARLMVDVSELSALKRIQATKSGNFARERS